MKVVLELRAHRRILDLPAEGLRSTGEHARSDNKCTHNDDLQVEGTLALFGNLKEQHRDVAAKSKALHDSCEALVAEKDRLVEFADALREKLAYFDELDSLSAKFHSVSLAVEAEDFLPMLRRLDECIA